MLIKKLTLSDYDQNINIIKSLFKMSFESSFKNIVFDDDFITQKIQQARSFLVDDNAIIYGVFVNKELCAIAYIYLTNVFERPYIHLNHIAVLNKYQRQGYAKHLLETILSYAEKNNISAIKLDVTAENKKAINLYKQTGFTIKRLQMEKCV